MTVGIVVGIVSGITVVFVAALSRILWRYLTSRRHRSRVRITLNLIDEVAATPFKFFLYRVKEGPESSPVINKAQPFHTVSANAIETYVSYPLNLGLQFKCFADWTVGAPPDLQTVQSLFEANGWRMITADGLQSIRFWFILDGYATKDTGDVNTYTNNWLPAGPREAKI
jgi:hypothetical protein